jgi:hypothetical protein
MLQWFLGVCYKGISSMLQTCFLMFCWTKMFNAVVSFFTKRGTLYYVLLQKHGLVAHVAFVLLHENSQMSTYFLSKFINPWEKCSKKCC